MLAAAQVAQEKVAWTELSVVLKGSKPSLLVLHARARSAAALIPAAQLRLPGGALLFIFIANAPSSPLFCCPSSPLLLFLSSPQMTGVERTCLRESFRSTRAKRRASRRPATSIVSTSMGGGGVSWEKTGRWQEERSAGRGVHLLAGCHGSRAWP